MKKHMEPEMRAGIISGFSANKSYILPICILGSMFFSGLYGPDFF